MLKQAERRVKGGLWRQNLAGAVRCSHGATKPQPPVPLLAPVDRLLLTDRGSDEERELTTLLVRSRNRVVHELAQVGENLRNALNI